ncbi:META domain-containing protein [Intrasporangium calvum]|uniref:DUF306 domain-containing protein n=1 Tax=Intrasporangium calvum (strain ATCC 23552 / DSM 43043 / JCM 3097 / NBRC 12989 / NCIMB 10167 / NRRL B-3866 / 7 KIP) TaxID=710696 RepID=E6S983_INTC7|nr:META domain-containing protein [Intrasporangium calvum]ADU47059.1 protein of unknown function DUF306 Meta and HslJ [Intrasporangium calvum DSM 43043]
MSTPPDGPPDRPADSPTHGPADGPADGPAAPAPRTAWVVEFIAGEATIDPKPQISLTEDGRVLGTTGVNRISGRYEAHNETVRITGAGMTRVAGSPEAMDQERRFLQALEGWNAFHVSDSRLDLGAPDTGLVCVLSESPTTPPSG